VFSTASLNPVALVQRLMAEVSMRTFRAQLEDAHRERQAVVEELRYAMTHISEVLGGFPCALLPGHLARVTFARRHVEGASPTSFLNARLNAASDS
jgi:hypothetical protein